MQVAVGYHDHPDSALAGRRAAEQALATADRRDTCDLVLLFCTARHDQKVLRRAVAEATGNARCIFGGGAVGVITNDAFGYAGDQVGVACFWLDDSRVYPVHAGDLSAGESRAGARLGGKLAARGVARGSPVLLFYDAVNKTPGSVRLTMGTWLLDGIENQLGFLPDIMGAGMIGDYVLTPTTQFLGSEMGSDHAFALTFSEDIHIDSVVLHGCHPGSPYFTVTGADDAVILEIDGRPAVDFLHEILGYSIQPEEYPFFLIFGVNYGADDGLYDAKNYATRLCQGIDKERGGIVVFEPDMAVGTRFQIMYRTQGLDYIRPQVQGLLDRLADEGREPFFAIYIDCAGRCAGYGGTDLEDAQAIKEIVRGRFPLFGIYAGGEIASLGGKPRSIDWTGVFCVFSQAGDGRRRGGISAPVRLWDREAATVGERKDLSGAQLEKLALQNMAKILELDAQSIVIRSELEQKRRGFALLAELAVSLQGLGDRADILHTATGRINAALNMQKTALLFPEPTGGKFTPFVLQGFTVGERAVLNGAELEIDADLLGVGKTILVTGEHDERYLADLRRTLNLPYFVAAPVMVRNQLSAVLIAGRMVEAPPMLGRLGQNETETMQAVGALLASIMVYKELDEAHRRASTDPLTGLYNRGVLERRVQALARNEFPEDLMVAFIMIDLDHLKGINDRYGHIVGDGVLRMLAQTLRRIFRSTDTIARFGGDEFVVFCTSDHDGGMKSIESRVQKLVYDWGKMPKFTADGAVFYSTLSVGISVADGKAVTFDELLCRADVALYETKQRGRNGYTIYTEQ